MNALRLLTAGLMLVAVATLGRIEGAAAAPPPTAARVITTPNELHAVVGDHFAYRPQVLNPGARPLVGILAHLNVASLTSAVYVDPEDWSSNRSVVIAHLAPGGQASLSWDIQAVSAGSFAVYVVLLPTIAAATDPLVVSPPVHVTVTERRTLNAAGSLPVVLAVPAVLAVLVWLGRFRSRRSVH